MSEGNTTDSFKSFADANEQGFVAADYLHLISKLKQLPSDFIIKLMEVVWPKFIERDGSVFVEPIFNEVRYRQMRESGSLNDGIEYWVNQFLVSDVFESLSYEEALHVAGVIAKCWNAKLFLELPDSSYKAKVCCDYD